PHGQFPGLNRPRLTNLRGCVRPAHAARVAYSGLPPDKVVPLLTSAAAAATAAPWTGTGPAPARVRGGTRSDRPGCSRRRACSLPDAVASYILSEPAQSTP